MLKKIGSLLCCVLFLCTITTAPALASEQENITIYSRSFDQPDEEYIHSAQTADSIGSGQIENGELKYRPTTEMTNGYIGYFSQPYDASSDGLLHIVYQTKLTHAVSSNTDYSVMVTTESNPDEMVNMWLGVRYWRSFGYRTNWQGEGHLPLNGSFFESYDAGEWKNSAIEGDPDAGNTIEYYIDMKSKLVAFVVNGAAGSAIKISSISNNPIGNISPSENVCSITGIVLPVAQNEELSYDNITAEIIPGASMSDYFVTAALRIPLKDGGLQDVNFSSGRYMDIAETNISVDDQAVRALKIQDFRYEFGETITQTDNAVIYVKFDMLADNVTNSGMAEFNFLSGDNKSYWFAERDGMFFRDGGEDWQYHWGTIVDKFYQEPGQYSITTEMYLDLKNGKAAVKYGESDWIVRDVPAAMVADGVYGVLGSREQNHVDTYLNHITIEKRAGSLTEQGIDWNYVGLSTVLDYESDPDAVLVEKNGNPSNKAMPVGTGNDQKQYLFLNAVSSGKLTISFDVKSQDGLNSSIKRIGLVDDSGVYLGSELGLFHGKIGITGESWNNDGDDIHAYIPLPAEENDWHHIEMVFDFDSEDNTASFYCNGSWIGDRPLPEKPIGGLSMDFEQQNDQQSYLPYYIDNLTFSHTGISIIGPDGNALKAGSGSYAPGTYRAWGTFASLSDDENAKLILAFYSENGNLVGVGCAHPTDGNLATVILNEQLPEGSMMKVLVWNGDLQPAD